ncbi:ATP-binding protein [Cryptosporangium minutisporangium]|uniref:ATP-binding protein n=1 Tax=Cryptosporangium minutisporangium TaxID=113569 RepID=UPI0031EF3BF8
MLDYVIEHSESLPLVVLGAHRTTMPDRSQALVDLIAGQYRLDGVRRLDLAPLDTESIADYLVATSGVPVPRAMRTAVLLRDRTGGNPFYLRELCREAGAVEARAPQAVTDALGQRIRGLSAQQRTTLTVAAVLGEEVDASEVVPLVRGADGLPALDDLVDAGLLDVARDRTEVYRFVHELVRQAALDALPSLERAEHHERAALLLEARGAPVRRLAHHFAGASLLGHGDAAVRYLAEAADIADRCLAHAEAAGLFEQAAAHSTDAPRRDALLARAAHSHLLACEFAEARDLYRRLTDAGDPERRLVATMLFEEVAWYTADSGPAVLALLRRAIADAQVDEAHPQYVAALASLARATSQSGAADAAEALAAQAITAARAAGDPVRLGTALAASVQIGNHPTVNDVKQARAEELADVAAQTGQWLLLGPSAYHRCTLAYQRGDAGELAAARVDVERTAVAAGHRYWSHIAGCAAYGVAVIEARFDDAIRLTEDLLALSGTFTGSEADGLYGVQSFVVRRETGGVEPARAFVTGRESWEEHWPPALLALYVELGLDDAARRMLTHLRNMSAEHRDSARRPATLAFVAEAALALQDPDAAAWVRPLLADYAGLNLLMGPFAAVFGAADRYLGALESLLGKESAGRRFEAALDLDDRTGSVLHRAYTLAAWSAHARSRGDGALAVRLHREAAALADQHGMVRLRSRLAQRVGRPAGLTRREQEVLRLVGTGCSNREIARALTLSEHTAANHVRNIMTKTGCGNRTQVAMFASAHGLLD